MTHAAWTGGFHGRLDVARTSILHSQGSTNSFITRSRRRRFDLPENVLVRAVAERLLGAVTLLRRANAITASGWSAQLHAIEGPLRRLLVGTVLREVPTAVPTAYEEHAACSARHPAYRSAASWLRLLRDGLDSRDPEAIARIVATGALAPLKDHTQFEIAVLLRLAQTLHDRLAGAQPGRWALQRTLILRDREEVFVFARDDGARVRIFYNRAELPSGACDEGIKHYLARDGRMRPDITVITELKEGRLARATVFEVKLSNDVGYLKQGFQQAMVYRWEYRDALTAWPKAVLVIPGVTGGPARDQDEVVVIGWGGWIEDELLAGLVRELVE